MKLPTVAEPQRYRGLYVYDFGEWTALGYTAEEIAVLLDSEVYRGGKAYKIVRASPNGHLELRGIALQRFQTESGLLFNRRELAAAETDFGDLCQLAQDHPPPGRAFVQLADRGALAGVSRYVTALIYPAEYEDEMAQWLLAGDYAGGDLVEGGASHVSNYYAEDHQVVRRQQLWSQDAIPSRSPQEVLAAVRRAVQR